MAIKDPKEKAEEIKMLNTFTKKQLVDEVVYLRRQIRAQRTMINNLTYKKHDNNL